MEPKKRNEMWTRLLPRPVKLTQPSSTVGGTVGWCSRPGNSVEAPQEVTNTDALRPVGGRPGTDSEDTDTVRLGAPAPQCPQQPGPQPQVAQQPEQQQLVAQQQWRGGQQPLAQPHSDNRTWLVVDCPDADLAAQLGEPTSSAKLRAKLRDAVLVSLRTPILFVQGTRDRLCPLDLLAEALAGGTAAERLTPRLHQRLAVLLVVGH